MNTVEFLSYLRSLDINVFVEENRLRCNAPKGALTPDLRRELQKRKLEIISFLQKNTVTNVTSPKLVSIPRDGSLPLSFAQQRLWFLDQLMPNNAFYNVPAALRLTGLLNLAALEQTFNEIVRRHEALRTTFAMVEGQPVQVIAPTLIVPLSVVDLRSLPNIERETQALRLITEAAQQPFNLSTDSLLRVRLLRLDETEHILLINLHHIVSDGWSMGVLIRELATLYAAISSEKPSPLPPLPIQYADFAYWQRQWLQEVGATRESPLQAQLTYWQQQLDGISILNLPTDTPRPATQTYRGATQFLQLSKSLSEALEALSQREGVTLFMTLLAAFQTLLYRYTQQEDITVGTPIANRNRSEIEPLIGFFVNSLVLRTNLSGNPTFQELLSRVREVAFGAYAHQDLPFEKLVEELHPERSLSQNPLFQVVFALQNAPMENLELQGLTLSPLQFVDTGATRFDLEFHLWETQNNDGISGFVVYSTDLFKQATINRMLGHFQTLLENIVAHPQTKIADLPILTEAERHQILVEWNNTGVDYQKSLCVHQLFEAQVEETPDAFALVFEGEQITYRELNNRSNQLAHYLQKNGVNSEVLVGLCVERSVEMVVGILGILKAGGAYVPFDPNYPSERLSFMLQDSQVAVILTKQQWVKRLEPHNSVVIGLDTDWQKIAQEIEVNLISKVTADNLAYVIYTSGTTGKPKGVEIEHRGLLNLIFWHQQAFSVSSLDRVTQVAGVAFDACGWEIFPYLTVGASIYFPNEEIRKSPELLQNWLVSKAITISFLPTPLAEKVLLLDFPNDTALRLLLTGGDKLNQYPLDSHSFQVANNYGPTENTVVTTSGYVPVKKPEDSPNLLTSDLAPAIGRPIANTQIYILDPYLQPVPIGIAGELYISGDGRARGYLNRPDLTAQQFIPNPFNNKPESRLYKTGDLVRYRLDGDIEFLGRIDEQVKIRGYRIELGEIESVLSQHPFVLQAVVMSREDVLGEKRLVAYVVLDAKYSDNQQENEEMQLQDEQVLQWQMLYDETYNQPATDSDPTFNIVGWNSSYTNQPIPEQEMKEWLENQVSQILTLQPKRVLEIGCGTGLLLFRIAPYCTQYLGTDFSAPSLNYIQQQLGQLPQVKLLQRMATDFKEVEAEAFDAVILNSIVQYFPSIDYLITVLDGAIKAVAPGGFIFIGDVRSLPLLQAFHASVQLFQAEPSLNREQLQQRVQMQLFQETELVIDPAFFYALKQRFGQIFDVQIQLIRGRNHNELTQFRYNVILYVGAEIDLPNPPYPEGIQNPPYQGGQERSKWLDWQENNLKVSTIRELLVENQPEILSISKIPNARVMAAVKTAQWLEDTAQMKTVGQFQKALQELENVGIEPEDLWALGELGYRVELNWSDSACEGCYDAVFVRQDVKDKTILPAPTFLRPWQDYANNPIQAKAARQLVPQLQTYLSQKLPQYMVPPAYVVLESLPLTPNGKVNRRALPAPDLIKSEAAGGYVAPQTVVEEVLVKIFAEVLGVKRVGIEDNFFELGGHSLLATQLVSRVRDAFGVELPLRSVFEAPAIAKLSLIVESLKDSYAQNQAPALVPISRESRRMKLSSLNQEGK